MPDQQTFFNARSKAITAILDDFDVCGTGQQAGKRYTAVAEALAVYERVDEEDFMEILQDFTGTHPAQAHTLPGVIQDCLKKINSILASHP